MSRENKKTPSSFTSIQISKRTKDILTTLALTPRESYENIIIRLLNVKIGDRTVQYKIISRENPDCYIVCCIDWSSSKENIRYKNMFGDFKYRISRDPINENVTYTEWVEFTDKIKNFDNLITNLSVLDYDESMKLDDFILRRIN